MTLEEIRTDGSLSECIASREKTLLESSCLLELPLVLTGVLKVLLINGSVGLALDMLSDDSPSILLKCSFFFYFEIGSLSMDDCFLCSRVVILLTTLSRAS